MNDDVYKQIKTIFENHPELRLKNFVDIATKAYQEVQINTIGEYHPIEVTVLDSDHSSYDSTVKHRKTKDIHDVDLRSSAFADDDADF